MSELLIKAMIAAAILGVLTTGYFGWRGHQRDIGAQAQMIIDQAEVNKLKAEAGEKLTAALGAKVEAERKLREVQDAQAVKDAKNLRSVGDLARQLAALAGDAGRLRDPNQTSGCGRGGGSPPDTATASAGAGAGDGAQAGGLLSAQLSGLLSRLTREADEINTAYISCRSDAFSIRGQ